LDPVLLVDGKVAFVPAGCQKIHSPSSGGFIVRIACELLFEFFDNLLSMFLLPFHLTVVVAADIPPLEHTIANDHFFGF
jgi:hypothetical protein